MDTNLRDKGRKHIKTQLSLNFKLLLDRFYIYLYRLRYLDNFFYRICSKDFPARDFFFLYFYLTFLCKTASIGVKFIDLAASLTNHDTFIVHGNFRSASQLSSS
jgi:hypothetical protein